MSLGPLHLFFEPRHPQPGGLSTSQRAESANDSRRALCR
jgi:hypothetical protein